MVVAKKMKPNGNLLYNSRWAKENMYSSTLASVLMFYYAVFMGYLIGTNKPCADRLVTAVLWKYDSDISRCEFRKQIYIIKQNTMHQTFKSNENVGLI